MLAIYKKELRSYFTSMMGYVFIAVFLIVVGLFFVIQNLLYSSPAVEDTLSSITSLFVFLVPLLTMRLMAEENKQKTDQLLYTSPITANAIVLGKFFAVMTIFGTVILMICFFPLILSLYGTIPMASGYSAIFGFALLGGAYLAIGLFISSLTESQVVAAVVTYIVFIMTLLMKGIAGIIPADNQTALVVYACGIILICLVLYLMMHNLTISILLGIISIAAMIITYMQKPTLFDGSLVRVMNWLSVITRYDSFSYGTFNVADVVYYLSVIILFTFLTAQVIKKKRWS
jgi:ABC-2 type transport system permease protein